MSNKHFMVDIETMGTDMKTDDLIQIGLLEVQYHGGFWYPGQKYKRTLFTDQVPKNEWIANHHKDLIPICNKMDYASPSEIRADLVGFFQKCGVNNLAMLMGLNATSFDVPWLNAKGYLKAPHNNKEGKLTGDHHYRIYELRGAYALAGDVLQVDTKNLMKMAEEAAPKLFEMPEGGKHDALYDCYNQLRTLNGIIALMRKK